MNRVHFKLNQWVFILPLVIIINAWARTTVFFFPFEDKVELKDTWDLTVDVPRWYSTTLDTIGERDSSIVCVPFDTVCALLKKSAMKRNDYLMPSSIVRIAGVLGADYALTGTVTRFSVVKRALNTDAPMNVTNEFNRSTHQQAGITVMGGLQSYSADIAMEIDIYETKNGQRIQTLDLDSEEKDAGFKMYLSFQQDNPELNFHYMARSPFGSVYFQRSIAGAVMHHFARKVQFAVHRHTETGAPVVEEVSKEYMEGAILAREGNDVYINLGKEDRLLQGEMLEVLKPDRPVRDEKGDTLGWVEKPVGTIKVRFIKAAHFSVADIIEEADSIRAEWTIRALVGEKKKDKK
ncbi:MAG: hypothetical protein GF401_17630 [Chitinivibrionales bacterium]|nr:hypothetical protein [Chitinivibrionales bacterium]